MKNDRKPQIPKYWNFNGTSWNMGKFPIGILNRIPTGYFLKDLQHNEDLDTVLRFPNFQVKRRGERTAPNYSQWCHLLDIYCMTGINWKFSNYVLYIIIYYNTAQP